MKLVSTLQIIVAVLFTLSSGLLSCKENTAPEDNSGIVYPDSGLSFSQHIRPIFLNSCAAIGDCHQSTIRAGGLDLETDPPDFQGNSGLVVIPFKPDESYLYQSLFGPVPFVSRRMPPPDFSAGGLPDDQIKAIGTWIKEGAKPIP